MENEKTVRESPEEQEARRYRRMARIRRKIIVLSGKGGVGKTSVAVNLAWSFAASGRRTGLLDIDLHGPDIALMLGVAEGRLTQGDDGIVPVSAGERLRAVSVSWAGIGRDVPVIWRGPMKTAVIGQFLGDVAWGDLDVLVIDSPPGTGDEPLSAIQMIPELDGAVVVTTPQDVAVLDARRSISFIRRLDIPVVGVVENMSGCACPRCGGEIPLFGRGGGERAAREMKVPFLGRIPFDPAVAAAGDAGRPFAGGTETPAARAFAGVVAEIDRFLEKKETKP